MASHMWCSKCGEKFPLYFKVCPDCNIALIDQRPGPAPAPNIGLVRIFVADNEELAGLAKALLNSEEIDFLDRFSTLQDLFGWGRFGAGYNFIVGPIELWVRAGDAEKAKACLEGLGTSTEESTGPLNSGTM